MKLKSLCIAATVLFGMAATHQASAICMAYAPPQAFSEVTQNTDGSFHYAVTAMGGLSGCMANPPAAEAPGYMSDFYLPYFADMGIANLSVVQTSGPITSGWDYVIDPSNDLFGLGGGTMRFYNNAWPGVLDFNRILVSFDAAYDEVKGPFQERVIDINTAIGRDFIGDPGIPGSPQTLAALSASQAPSQGQGNVPEPATVSLLALGTAALAIRRRKQA